MFVSYIIVYRYQYVVVVADAGLAPALAVFVRDSFCERPLLMRHFTRFKEASDRFQICPHIFL